MKAPINLFFDVTPLGKILQIFTEDMHCFKGEIVMPLEHCMNMITHMFVVVSLMFSIADWEVLIGFTILAICMRYATMPYWVADNQLCKVWATLWSPVESYFHECMRGTTIIRAYG